MYVFIVVETHFVGFWDEELDPGPARPVLAVFTEEDDAYDYACQVAHYVLFSLNDNAVKEEDDESIRLVLPTRGENVSAKDYLAELEAWGHREIYGSRDSRPAHGGSTFSVERHAVRDGKAKMVIAG